jgi:MFS family permease
LHAQPSTHETSLETPVRSYRELLADPVARWPLISSSVARLSPGMVNLAIAYAMTGFGFSWTAAGVVTAAHQIGIGVASPLQGKLVDRHGQHRVLIPDAALYLAGTLALAYLIPTGAPVAVLVAVAALTGATFPPITACVRVLMSRMFPSGQRRETAFAFTGVAVELGFILGPLTAVTIAETIGPVWALLLAGVPLSFGALGYAASAAPRQVGTRDPSTGRSGALRSPGVRAATLAFGGVAVAFGVFDISVLAVAEAAGMRSAAGWLIPCIATGAATGALVYGARRWPGTSVQRIRITSAALAGALLLLPLLTGVLPLFAVVLFVTGLCIGPTMIIAFQLIDDLALPGTQTEAQAWSQAAIVAGIALGASLSGVIVDHVGARWAFLVGALSVGVGALVLTVRRDALSRPLRGSDHAASVATATRAAGHGSASVTDEPAARPSDA